MASGSSAVWYRLKHLGFKGPKAGRTTEPPTLPRYTVNAMNRIPDRNEAAEYYFTYIDQVSMGEICEVLNAQLTETVALLRGISDEQSLHRYAPGKWTIRQVVSHLNDTERVFVFRAFWFARGFDSPLPSFDQNIAVSAAGADERSWESHLEEFRAVRTATLAFFQTLPAEAWSVRGVASENPFTVRALAYIVAGHVAHHIAILRERYLKI
jgi:DinB superfamily